MCVVRVQLVAVLREVKYLLIRNMEEIPASASQLYSNNDTLLTYVAHLDLTVAWYNKIRETVLEVEYPIIEGQLQLIDVQLRQAEETLDWQTDGKSSTLTASIRPHRSTTYLDAAYCYRPTSVVCRSVCHTSEPCRNGWTDRDAVRDEDSGGPREPCIRWGPDPPWEAAILMGKGLPIVKYKDTLRSSVQKRFN